MKHPSIVVLGTGGMGRESLAWVRDTYPDRQVLGFLDDSAPQGRSVIGYPVLGPLGWLEGRNVECVVAIGSPEGRRKAASQLREVGASLLSVVHPRAYLGPGVRLGDGTIVGPNVTLTRDIVVGQAAILNFGCQVGHDCRIGDFAFVGPGVSIAGNVAILAGASVGIGATVIEGISVGAWSRIGAGAAVIRDIPGDVTAVGVPCRPIT